MSIQSVSAASYPSAAQYTNWKNSFDQLTQAIQSGDLTAAQQAYQSLSQQLPATGNGAAGPGSAIAQALGQIGNALQAGNLTQAQQALSSLQQQHGHHHHHGGGGKAETASSANGQSSSGTDASATTPAATSGSGIDISA